MPVSDFELGQNYEQIQEPGLLNWAFKECNPFGVVTGSVSYGSFLTKRAYSHKAPRNTITLVDNSEVPTGLGKEEVMYVLTSAQYSADWENFVTKEVKEKYYQTFHEVRDLGSTKAIRFSVVGQFEVDWEDNAPGAEHEIRFRVLKNTSGSFTPNWEPNFVTAGTSGSYAVGKNEYSTVVEQ